MGQEALCFSVCLWWNPLHSAACRSAHKLVRKMSFWRFSRMPKNLAYHIIPCSEILSYLSGKNHYAQHYWVPKCSSACDSQSSCVTLFNLQFMNFYSELVSSVYMIKKRFGYKKPAFFCMIFCIWKFMQPQKDTILVVKVAASLKTF